MPSPFLTFSLWSKLHMWSCWRLIKNVWYDSSRTLKVAFNRQCNMNVMKFHPLGYVESEGAWGRPKPKALPDLTWIPGLSLLRLKLVFIWVTFLPSTSTSRFRCVLPSGHSGSIWVDWKISTNHVGIQGGACPWGRWVQVGLAVAIRGFSLKWGKIYQGPCNSRDTRCGMKYRIRLTWRWRKDHNSWIHVGGNIGIICFSNFCRG